MNKKFLIVGRTASGKSSIAREVCKKLGLVQVKSYTTRVARPGETSENSDHYYISEDEFEMIMDGKDGDVAAYTEINGVKYCTTTNVLEQSDVYVIDPNGVDYLKEKCAGQFDFVEIYVRVPYKTAEQRFINRGGTKKEFEQRYEKESKQFGEYEKQQKFQYHLLNDKPFEESVDLVCKWINKERNI